MRTTDDRLALAELTGAADVDGRHPLRHPAALAPWVRAGVLQAADVHVARTLCRVTQDVPDDVLLAVALAVRAPRLGHTCLGLDEVAAATVADADREADRDLDRTGASTDPGPGAAGDLVARLPWPDPAAWVEQLRTSPLCEVVDEPGPAAGRPDDVRPLVLEGHHLHLRRQLEQEATLAADLRRRAAGTGRPTDAADDDRLAALLDRLFPGVPPDDPQRTAAATAARRALTVVAGGPGTGKTWTVARMLAVLVAIAHADGEHLQVALVAPTGKAAARLDEGIRSALDQMDVDDDVRDAIASIGRGQTIHGLLGRRGNAGFRHDRLRPLPHDVVVVDETSMASLSLVHHLLAAVRREARIILVGDPDQLQSVEAGSVLGDVVAGMDDGIVTLTRARRFREGAGIATLAAAVRAGDADAAVAALSSHHELGWIRGDADLQPVRDLLVDRAGRMVAAARGGEVDAARRAMQELVVLCAHRRGSHGVAGWNDRVDRWLAGGVDGWRPWQVDQPGRVLLASHNDRHLQVFNGDLGIVVAGADGRHRVAFHGTGSGHAPIDPVRLSGLEPVHAMTIHKSQGSQWEHVVVVLPDGPSRILSRQLLYTAITRAASRVTVVGGEAALRAAVERPVRRTSTLAARLRAGQDRVTPPG